MIKVLVYFVSSRVSLLGLQSCPLAGSSCIRVHTHSLCLCQAQQSHWVKTPPPQWPHFSFITRWETLVPNTFTSWGPGGYSFSGWIVWKHSSTCNNSCLVLKTVRNVWKSCAESCFTGCYPQGGEWRESQGLSPWLGPHQPMGGKHKSVHLTWDEEKLIFPKSHITSEWQTRYKIRKSCFCGIIVLGTVKGVGRSCPLCCMHDGLGSMPGALEWILNTVP